MKRFVISEDERRRILSMHESATKRQYLSEQPAPQPAGNVNKGVEMNNDYLQKTHQFLAANPKFVDLVNKNNINIVTFKPVKFVKVNDGLAYTGTDGKVRQYPFLYFKGTEDYSNAHENFKTVESGLKKIYDNYRATPEYKACVDPVLPKMVDNDHRASAACKAVITDINKYKTDNNYSEKEGLKRLADFVQYAPKWKTA